MSETTQKETPAERKRRIRALERAAHDAARAKAAEQAARRRETRKAPTTLFGTTGEGRTRLTAVLDALDFVACEDRDGWIRLAVWHGRCEQVGIARSQAAAERRWSRMLRNMRRHGIDYYCYAAGLEDGGDGVGSTGMNQKNPGAWIPWERTAIRLTPDGEDRLRALVNALDAWLVARAGAGELAGLPGGDE